MFARPIFQLCALRVTGTLKKHRGVTFHSWYNLPVSDRECRPCCMRNRRDFSQYDLDGLNLQIGQEAMFKAACYQFTKGAGGKTLYPVPSIDEKSNVGPLQLVVKTTKRRFIFFSKATYHPTEFQLHDVLKDPSPVEVEFKHEDFLTDYEKVTKFSLKGKFGAELCEEIVDVNLETSDNISLSIKFGKLNKSEVEMDKLIPALQRRRINMDHPFIQQIRKQKKKVLCIMTGVVSLDAGGTISRVSDMEASVGGKVTVGKTVSASAEADIHKDRELGLPAGTPVAYNLHELNIGTKQGDMTLMLARGQHGGFSESVGYDDVDATSVMSDGPGAGHVAKEQLEIDLQHPRMVFKAFLALPVSTRDELRSVLLGLLSVSRDVKILADLLDKIVQGEKIKDTVSSLQKQLFTPKEQWLRLLEMAGFSDDSGKLREPREVTEFFSGLDELFDAVTCLDDEELDLIRLCSPATVPDLLVVLQNGLRGLPVSCDKVPSISDDSTAQKLLLQLEYSIGLDTLTPPPNLPDCIDEVYWTLFALWGHSDS